MEIYVTTKLNNIDVSKKLSLFDDTEDIILTKVYNNQQLISGYGSFSNQFSVPCDSNNVEIFHYYNIIGAQLVKSGSTTFDNFINPNFFIKARLIVNGYEIIGNLQLNSFSTKNEEYYSFNLIFYGDEKNLITVMDNSISPKLNDSIVDDVDFTFNYANVVNTWTGITFHFVPIMANQRALSYSTYTDAKLVDGNIAYSGITYSGSITGGTCGVNMSDLNVSYSMKGLFDKLFANYNIEIIHSSGVTEILDGLYLMINTKVTFFESLTYIYTKAVIISSNYCQLLIATNPPTTIGITGIIPGNEDTSSWNDINSAPEDSQNWYTASETRGYIFNLNFNFINPIQYSFGNYYTIQNFVEVYDTAAPTIAIGKAIFSVPGSVKITCDLISGHNYSLRVYYSYTVTSKVYKVPYDGSFTLVTTTYKQAFHNNEVSAFLKISKDIVTNAYNRTLKTITFTDILSSEFFTKFCKSFNIFFIYNDDKKTVNTYKKTELPANTYDLTKYLLLNKSYTFTNQQKFKKIDYKFTTPKDINNLAYRQSFDDYFGQFTATYPYNVGVEKNEFTSIFTVFPQTSLNETSQAGQIMSDTRIPLHSELDATYKALSTDFLLFYRGSIVSGTSQYYLQDGLTTYKTMTTAPDYGNFHPRYSAGNSGITLDYNYFTIWKDNTNVKYETVFEFLLPFDLVYNLKVYDYLFINNTWFEIQELIFSMQNGYTKIKVLNVSPNEDISYLFPEQITTTTTTTVFAAPTIVTNAVIETSYTSMKLSGNVTNQGSSTVTAKGFVYSYENIDPNVDDDNVIISGDGLGEYEAIIYNLVPNTTYYIKAFCFSNDYYYGNLITANTLVNEDIISYKQNSLTSSYFELRVNDTTSFTSTDEIGVCYNLTNNPNIFDDDYIIIDYTGTPVPIFITGLTSDELYYVRPFAINNNIIEYGNTQSYYIYDYLSLIASNYFTIREIQFEFDNKYVELSDLYNEDWICTNINGDDIYSYRVVSVDNNAKMITFDTDITYPFETDDVWYFYYQPI